MWRRSTCSYKSHGRNSDGALVSYCYEGLVEVNPEFLLILTNDPRARTTDYGNSVSHVTFETGSDSLKHLEHSLFVGSAHFVVTEGGKYYVETKISRILG